MNIPVGIIAGGGILPWELASSLKEQGTPCFVVALKNFSTPPKDTNIPYIELPMGKVRSILEAFHKNHCHQLVLLGPVKRISIFRLSLDLLGLSMLLRIGRSWFKGDDNLLRSIIKRIEGEGFQVRGAHEVLPSFMSVVEAINCRRPSVLEQKDIDIGFKYLQSVSPQDIGQSCIVSEGKVVVLEGRDGTDAMLRKVAGTLTHPEKAIFVKAAKTTQDLRVDMPTVGLTTAQLVTSIGMAGMAIEKDKVLVVDFKKVSECLSQYNCFLSVS